MKREKLLTKRERKALAPARPKPAPQQRDPHDDHIHCVACGAHLHEQGFTGSFPEATWLTCQHGSSFAACTKCVGQAHALLAEHDSSGQPVRTAPARH